jgi:tRNA (guanosine-2'-O-)-methyltransferase
MTPERFARLKAVLDRRQPDLTVLAEDVHKSHNIAAILRTCDAVGIPELHAVSPGGAFARHRMVSGGSRKWVRARLHADIEGAVGELHSHGFHVVAAHLSGESADYRSWDFTRPTALLLGAELLGVSTRAAALADRHLVVPMRGLVASLNVSVAAAVILYEAARQREAAGLYDRCRLDPLAYRDILFEWSYPEAARLCRAKAIPYPALDAEGFIQRPALAQALRRERSAAARTGRRTSGAGS